MVRAMAEQPITLPTWSVALLGIVGPLVSGGLAYTVASGKASAVVEQRLADMERRSQATDSRLDTIGERLANVSTSVAVLVERTQRNNNGPMPR